MALYKRVYIEISNVCNLQCSFCPEVERAKKIMSFELFQNVIAQLKGVTEEVTFHLMGEPMTHPQFYDFLKHCEEVGMLVHLTTNGTMLKHKERAEWLLNPTLRQVNFSLQSFTANHPADQLHDYMEPLIAFARRALVARPDLYINFRLWNKGSAEDLLTENRHFLEPLEKAFGTTVPNWDDVAFRKSILLKGRAYIHFDSRFDWPSLRGPVSSSRGFCYGLNSHFAIHADGTIVPCCLDKEAGIALGQVCSTERGRTKATGGGIHAALASPRAQNMKDGFANFELREELCRRCTFIRRFDSKQAVLKV